MAKLPDLTEHHLAAARATEHGRSAELIAHDGVLRQSVIALAEGTRLAEHNSPKAATIQVLVGRVEVTGGGDVVLDAGDLVVLTHERHAVTAHADSVFLLTTVTSVENEGAPERAR